MTPDAAHRPPAVGLATVVPRVGPDRLHRLRRAARAHRAAARAVRRATRLARRARVRGRASPPATCCPDRPPPSSRSSAPGGSAAALGALVGGRRVHRARADRDPRAGRAVPGRLTAAWVRGAGAGAGAAVAAVAVQAGAGLAPGRAGGARAARDRRGGSSTCWPARSPRPPSGRGSSSCCSAAALIELRPPRRPSAARPARPRPLPLLGARPVPAPAGCSPLAWVAFKVGALSYGGGFVIIPLMQADAVDHYHWMTDGAVPQRRRARPDHPRPGRPDRRRRRLRRRRHRRRPAGRRWSRSPRRSRSSCSAPRRFDRLRGDRRRQRLPRRRRPGRDRRHLRLGHPARPRAHRALAVRRPRRRRSSCCSRCAAASCSPCSPPPRSASSSSWPAGPYHTDSAWSTNPLRHPTGPVTLRIVQTGAPGHDIDRRREHRRDRPTQRRSAAWRDGGSS